MVKKLLLKYIRLDNNDKVNAILLDFGIRWFCFGVGVGIGLTSIIFGIWKK